MLTVELLIVYTTHSLYEVVVYTFSYALGGEQGKVQRREQWEWQCGLQRELQPEWQCGLQRGLQRDVAVFAGWAGDLFVGVEAQVFGQHGAGF